MLIVNLVEMDFVVFSSTLHTDIEVCKEHFFKLRGPQNGHFNLNLNSFVYDHYEVYMKM